MIDKYNLKVEENIFLAKKLIVSNIYSNARIEECNVTFPETLYNKCIFGIEK